MDKSEKPIKILVVDDEPLLNEILCRQVRKAGHEVVSATSGNQAIDILEEDNNISTVITDVRMPNGDGIFLLEEAKKIRHDLPVMLMTGYTDLPLPEAYDKGAAAVLHKPFDLTTIIQKLEKSVEPLEETLSTDKKDIDFTQVIKIEVENILEKSEDFALGGGGFMATIPVAPLKQDQEVWFTVKSDREFSISGHGEIAWIKAVPEKKAIKVGVRISGLVESSKSAFLGFKNEARIRCFIPNI